MSNTVTALNGNSFNGAITVQDAGLQGMITLRGDLSSDKIAKAVKSITGAVMPEIGKTTNAAKGSVLWMSPDELMLLVDYAQADSVVAKLEKALSGVHMLAANVSDARAVINLSGATIRDVLAKGTPANMSADVLALGDLRRTRLGQLPVAFWLETDKTAKLICFRSVGEHVFTWLKVAAQKGATPKFYA